MNEADLLAREVYTFARGRAGRYPDMDEGGPSSYGVLADCNAPEFGNWLYKDIFLNQPDDVDLFRQPSGFSPQAENLANLPPGYYTKQSKGAPDWYVRRMIENMPGYSRAGKPVYPEFDDPRHVAAAPLEPIPGLAINIGLDAGGSPAAAIGQRMPNGQWRILDELVTEAGTGPSRFSDMLAQRLRERYGAWPLDAIHGWADPSAAYGADQDAGELDWIQIVANGAGIRIDPAPSNAPPIRWEAVRHSLVLSIDRAPAFLLSPNCTALREGFNSGYRFRKLNIIGAEDRYNTEAADKNEFSHPHDALQYLMLGAGEYEAVMTRNAAPMRAASKMQHEHEWDPLR